MLSSKPDSSSGIILYQMGFTPNQRLFIFVLETHINKPLQNVFFCFLYNGNE